MKHLVAISLLFLFYVVAPSLADEVVRPYQMDVAITDVSARGDLVSGIVENHSELTVRNPRILVRHSWLWADETNPGSNSPGRSEIFTVPAEIPPGGSFMFSHELPRGPEPDEEGRFVTSAEVVGFEQVGRRPVTSSRR